MNVLPFCYIYNKFKLDLIPEVWEYVMVNLILKRPNYVNVK